MTLPTGLGTDINQLDFNCFLFTYDQLIEKIIKIVNPLVNQLIPTIAVAKKKNNPKQELYNLLNIIKESYNDVAYHSFYHAFSVFHMLYLLLTQVPKLTEKFKTIPIYKFLLLLAALCHDVDHCGFSNTFYTTHPIAKTDVCTHKIPVNTARLEIHHGTVTETLVTILDRRYVDDMKIMILYTDMGDFSNETFSHHENLVQTCKSLLNSKSTAHEDLLKLCGLLLHCADISNPVLPFELFYQWTVYINYEMAKQEEHKLKQTPGGNVAELTPNALASILNAKIKSTFFLKKIAQPLWNNVMNVLNKQKNITILNQIYKNLIVNERLLNQQITTPKEPSMLIAQCISKAHPKTIKVIKCSETKGGGDVNIYMEKYLKYKTKYLNSRSNNL